MASREFPNVPDWDWLIAEFPSGVLFHDDMPFDAVVTHCRGQLAYLATPYSKEVLRDGAWCPVLSANLDMRAARWTQRFAIEGVTALSPIVAACAAVATDAEGFLDPLDGRFWTHWCAPVLRKSDCVIVPRMCGWDRSAGIWHEVCFALAHNVPVYLVRFGSEFAATRQGVTR